MLLLEYPPEILNQIFFNLLYEDVKELEAEVELTPFYMECKYRHIRLHPPRYRSYNQIWPPLVHALALPLYMSQLRLKVLEFFEPSIDLSVIPREILAKFEHIDHVGSYYLSPADCRMVSDLDNIRTLKVDCESKDFPKFPKCLEILHVAQFEGQFQFPQQLVELELDRGSLHQELPLNLRKLILGNVRIGNWRVKLPETLVQLELDYAGREIDLLSLCNLEVLKFRFIGGTQLDLAVLERLRKVDVSNGQCIFPKSVVDIVHRDSTIDLQNIQELPFLKSLELLNCEVGKTEVLDVKYPSSLKVMRVERLRVKNSNQAYPDILLNKLVPSDSIVKFSNLPSNLREFNLDFHEPFDYGNFIDPGRIRIDSKVEWPESVREISLGNFGGFSKNILEHPGNILDGMVFPLGLKKLSILEVPLKLIVNTNLADLNLQLLQLDQKIVIPDRLHITHVMKRNSQSLQPDQKEASFKHLTMIITNDWFSSPSLTALFLRKCTLTIPKQVILPSTVRELVMDNCKLTTSQWNLFVCPPHLEKLSLLHNLLDNFDLSSTGTKLEIVQLTGNPFKEEMLEQVPRWKEIRKILPCLNTTGWKLDSWSRLPDLGDAYTVEKVLSDQFGQREIVIIIITAVEIVVHEYGRTHTLRNQGDLSIA